MSFDDASVFLRDFGKPCSAMLTEGDAPVPFVGMLDQPAAILDLGRVSAHSIEYELTFATNAVRLARNTPVRVDGVAYTCREAPRPIDDGLFSTVLLSPLLSKV